MLFALLLQILLHIGSISCTRNTLPELNPLSPKSPVPENNLLGRASSPTPSLQLKGYVNIIVDLSQFRSISIPEGKRLNINILGGNWTNPDGSLLAKIIPNIGGEQGYIDATNVFHLDVRYVVQFVSDNKYGYVQAKGPGKIGASNKVIQTVETDSTANLTFNNRLLYSPGIFSGNCLTAPIWAL
ncbi:uncharacterized protein EI90DRAFT_1789184 [Cantharellus anzutake]|uniref:uncharacterized protein n=1 Tax=Cantharellus anzutake TaxID=1750568 RepID=UPI00190765E0|nr:uncharacterized protein EI90DRAFT_1789184 [Cantharellus anzutake]KAF8327390.1 hypothetical protein EI90DRAFT_1789184 [Cantharellus anzutake]